MSNQNRNRKSWTALFLALIVPLSSCAQQSPPSYQNVPQEAFLERLDAACDSLTPVPLKSLTSVEWDRAFMFPQGTSPEKFEKATGNQAPGWGVFGTYTPEEWLLVLQRDGKIVQLTTFTLSELHGNREHPRFDYDADVLVKMTPSDRGCIGELMPASSSN